MPAKLLRSRTTPRPPSTPNFQVTRLCPLDGPGPLLAVADVHLPPLLTLTGVRLIRQPGGHLAVNLAQPYATDTGTRYHAPLRLHQRRWRQALTQCVADAWQRTRNTQETQETQNTQEKTHV